MVDSLKNYEKEVIRILVSNVLSSDRLDKILKDANFLGYEYTGSGYFVKIHHPFLPKDRITCSEPTIFGKSGDVNCGFVIFIDKNELTIECHSWGETNVPSDFRDRNIQLREL